MTWSYEKAGVDIEKGNSWIDVISRIISNHRSDPAVIGGIGSFAGLYALNEREFLAACCDGVGTKLELAKKTGLFKGLGQDLVAMNLNDLVTCNARPLFFLDYIACGKLDQQILARIMEGIVDSCESCNCILLGGETAEMPDVYSEKGFDLAGFSVGLGDRSQLIDGSTINEGDVITGLYSSGIHSNGFSLVRHVIGNDDLNSYSENLGNDLGKVLLEPTRLYVNQALSCASTGCVKAMAHITGGGLVENISRTMPESLKPEINFGSWTRLPVFDYLAGKGIPEDEMRKVFNLGIGFAFITSSEDVERLNETLLKLGEKPVQIGKVIRQ